MTLATVLALIGSVQRFFDQESRSLLGGDITIEHDGPIDRTAPLFQDLEKIGVGLSTRIDTLIVVQNDAPSDKSALESLLVSLKVVDHMYPLYGTLESSVGTRTPTAEEVFVAPDVLSRMGVSVGDSLTIGNTRLRIAATIAREPDNIGGGFRLGPLVVISSDAWKKIGIDGKQSRMDYTVSVRYPETMNAERRGTYTAMMRDAYPRPAYRVSVAEDGPGSLVRILDAAERFFFTTIVLALFLVIVNIRLNLVYVLTSFQTTIAIMRSLGMRRSQLFVLFLSLLLAIATVAGAIGGILGNILAELGRPLIEGYVNASLPAVPLFGGLWVVTLFTGMLCIFAATGFIARVLSIEPKMLLLGYGTEHGRLTQVLKELPTLVLTLLGLYGGVYYLTERALVALYAVASIAGIFTLLFFFARTGIALGYRSRFSLPFALRSIMNFLKHQGLVGTTAIASLTIALASIFSIALIERNVLGNLSAEFKADAPNLYLIDIQEDQLEGVRSIMGPTWKEFSVIRARFIERDGYDIQGNLATEDPELRREFNITSGTELIEGERVIDGTWHGTDGTQEVSVEKDFAERAKLRLGSSVRFFAQGTTLEARVTSIREVTTTNGLPFFFLVFSPDVLEGLPRSSFGYAYIEDERIPALQNELARTYPNISSVPTTQIIETIGRAVGALSGAVVATTIPALMLGFLLIIAMLAISVRERGNDMRVFTAFGAQTPLLFSMFVLESVMVVVLSGIFAGIIAHTSAYLLGLYLFDFTRFYFSLTTLVIFVTILTITIVFAYLFARRFVRLSPMDLLRERR
jgi:putative ABC transport system permease protein